MDALVLAGGRLPSEFAEKVGETMQALLTWRGQSLLEIALRALREAPGIGHIVVVGADRLREAVESALYDELLPESASGPANILKGLQHLSDQSRVLVSSCDLPFLSSRVVENLLHRIPPEAEFAYPCFLREEVEEYFPGRRKSYFRLADGTLTGGNVVVLSPPTFLAQRTLILQVFQGRKNLLRLLSLFGPRLLVKGMSRRLRIADLERRASAILRGCCKAVRGGSPALAFDVDHWEDWEYLLRWAGG